MGEMPPSASKPLINLLRGWPNPSLLPAARLKAATNAALSDPKVFEMGLEYAPDEGWMPLREQVASWLTDFYRPPQPITTDRISITGGASQNLACLLQVFSDPLYTRNVWMIAPCYLLACRMFEDAGFAQKMRAVPEDGEGIDLGYLRREMQRSEKMAEEEGNTRPTVKPERPWRKVYKHIIYAVPTFANPSSKVMSLRRREELVKLARQFDALIVTDDVYDQLQWPASLEAKESVLDHALLPRVVDIDRTLDGGAEREDAPHKFGNAVSNGSFSKILGPGIRTGWAEGTPMLAWGLSQV